MDIPEVKKYQRIGKCTHCGDCCIARPFSKSMVNGKCYYWNKNTMRCNIYDHRPYYCNNFPDHPDQIKEKHNCGYKFKEVVNDSEFNTYSVLSTR